MKLLATVTYLSETISIPKKDSSETTPKRLICVEEINDDKEKLDSPAIDFIGDKVETLDNIHV